MIQGIFNLCRIRKKGMSRRTCRLPSRRRRRSFSEKKLVRVRRTPRLTAHPNDVCSVSCPGPTRAGDGDHCRQQKIRKRDTYQLLNNDRRRHVTVRSQSDVRQPSATTTPLDRFADASSASTAVGDVAATLGAKVYPRIRGVESVSGERPRSNMSSRRRSHAW